MRASQLPGLQDYGPCWNWEHSLKRDGYGQVRACGTIMLAHRRAWEIQFGKIPNGMFICHHCDNPRCINVDHLFMGTHLENMADMRAKGRTKGELHVSAKLTQGEVLEMRAIYATGEISQRDLASRYGMSRRAIRHILNRTNWGHI